MHGQRNIKVYPLHVSNKQVHQKEVTSVQAANVLATRRHIYAWKMLYAACTEVTT
jgi:hypothetical protein